MFSALVNSSSNVSSYTLDQINKNASSSVFSSSDWFTAGILTHTLTSRCGSYTVIRLTTLSSTTPTRMHLILEGGSVGVVQGDGSRGGSSRAAAPRSTNLEHFTPPNIGHVIAILNPLILRAVDKDTCPLGLLINSSNIQNQVITVGKALHFGICSQPKCRQVIDTHSSTANLCYEHVKQGIEMMRRQRQQFSNSVVVFGNPTSAGGLGGSGMGSNRGNDLNAFYVLPDGTTLAIHGAELRVSVPGKAGGGGDVMNKPVHIQARMAARMEDRADQRMVAAIASRPTIGARHIRMARNVDTGGTDGGAGGDLKDHGVKKESGAFSAEAIRALGFDPSAGKSTRYRMANRAKFVERSSGDSDLSNKGEVGKDGEKHCNNESDKFIILDEEFD